MFEAVVTKFTELALHSAEDYLLECGRSANETLLKGAVERHIAAALPVFLAQAEVAWSAGRLGDAQELLLGGAFAAGTAAAEELALGFPRLAPSSN